MQSLIVAFFANLLLNFLIFSPVASFHTPPLNWLYSYAVVIVVLVIYRFTWTKKEAI
jgi:hypothetical protein